jgi:hypothetical protein
MSVVVDEIRSLYSPEQLEVLDKTRLALLADPKCLDKKKEESDG